ncbi:MAG: hypothetical protein R2941_26000 [Desulfobacterales bacterium]
MPINHADESPYPNIVMVMQYGFLCFSLRSLSASAFARMNAVRTSPLSDIAIFPAVPFMYIIDVPAAIAYNSAKLTSKFAFRGRQYA